MGKTSGNRDTIVGEITHSVYQGTGRMGKLMEYIIFCVLYNYHAFVHFK